MSCTLMYIFTLHGAALSGAACGYSSPAALR
jgi:hypothetical protein